MHSVETWDACARHKYDNCKQMLFTFTRIPVAGKKKKKNNIKKKCCLVNKAII